MKRILYATILMMTVNIVNAQEKSVYKIAWAVAAVLPPAAGLHQQPGVAGPVT